MAIFSLASHCPPSIHVCVPLFSSYKNNSHIGFGPTLMTSFYTNYFFKLQSLNTVTFRGLGVWSQNFNIWTSRWHNTGQNTIKILVVFLKMHPKIHMESRGTPNSQNNLEKEQSWRLHTYWFQNQLQSYSNQNSMILAWKQTYTQWNRTVSPKPSYVLSNDFQQGYQDYLTQWGRVVSSECRENWIATCKSWTLTLYYV